MKKGILLGIGILIILLAFAGNGSARGDGSFGSVCSACHSPALYPLTTVGTHFSETHRPNATATSIAPPACANCHVVHLLVISLCLRAHRLTWDPKHAKIVTRQSMISGLTHCMLL